MDTHVKLLGILNIVFGALSAVFAITTLIMFGSVTELYAAAQADFTIAALLASFVFHAFVAIPCIVLGWAVMQYSDAAKSLLIVISALNLLNMPVGSVIGGYGLWVLMTPETDPLFAEPPRRTKARKPALAPSSQTEDDKPDIKAASILRSRGADAGPQ